MAVALARAQTIEEARAKAEAVAKGMSIYLLFAIGFKGGVALAEAPLGIEGRTQQQRTAEQNRPDQSLHPPQHQH